MIEITQADIDALNPHLEYMGGVESRQRFTDVGNALRALATQRVKHEAEIRALSGAVEAERERCAKIVASGDVVELAREHGILPAMTDSPGTWIRRTLAAAIRSSLKEGEA